MNRFEQEIKNCRTPSQVMAVLKKYNKKIQRNDSEEIGCFSIWLDNVTRIYKPFNRKNMILQTWKPIKVEYSGVPTFFG